jgi:hypothetical protein
MDPFAVVYDVAASWTSYTEGPLSVDADCVTGLIVHAAGATDEGFRVIDVWESQDAFVRHSRTDRGCVALDTVVPPLVRELRVLHIVIGPAPCEPTSQEDNA